MQPEQLIEEGFHYLLLNNCMPFYFGKVRKKYEQVGQLRQVWGRGACAN